MREIKTILQSNDFRFNKQFGQNFITDKNLLRAIVEDACITQADTVVEIGAGAGTLTVAISDAAKKVYAYEIDRNLKPVLAETLSGRENVEVLFRDFMRDDLTALEQEIGCAYHVIANLPYYITTPVIMRFLEDAKKCASITVTVQREVADRLSSEPGSADYSAITASVRARANVKKTRDIPRTMFYPVPNVDSAVITITPVEDKYPGVDEKTFKLIKNAFLMRRKTLVNNIVSAYSVTRVEAEDILSKLGYDVRVRGERLDVPDFVKIANKIAEVVAE